MSINELNKYCASHNKAIIAHKGKLSGFSGLRGIGGDTEWL